MDTDDPFAATHPAPTAARPLLGLTILVVEDSRFACEAMRLLCLRSGARIRRADCLRSARRHLRVYRPSVAMIDLGLPDGSGLDLIRELTSAHPPAEAVLAMSADDHMQTPARSAGAHGFLAKPINSLAEFQESILSLMPTERRPPGPRLMNDEHVEPDLIAYQDDIAHAADVLEDSDEARALDYVAQFLGGVARSARDRPLEDAAAALAEKRALGHPAGSEAAMIAGIIHDRLARKIAI